MFTQNEEEWKETDDRGSSEYRRRMTHEDICHCCDIGQCKLRSVSQNWRKSTDYCGGFSDYMTLRPSQLWFSNDLKQRNRQRQCHHSLNCSSRNSQYYRGEAIHNRHKGLGSTSQADESVKSLANLRTVRVMPKEFVTRLAAAKDSRKFQVDNINANATVSANIPIDTNESRKASDVPYYGPFRARLIKITSAMIPIKTRNYRSIREYYSSERKYFREIQNDEPEIKKNSALIKATHDTSNDSRIKPDTCGDIISKRVCSEFDEMPLFASTVPKFDNQTNLLSTIPKIDDQMNPRSLSSAAMIDESELPKKLFEKNSVVNKSEHKPGYDKLMEESTFKKGYDKDSSSHEKSEVEVVSEKNPEIRENLQGKMQQMGIKKIADFWHRKTLEKINQSGKNLQKLQPSQFDHNLYDKENNKVEDDKRNSQVTSQNVDNTAPIDKGNESKFMTEILQVRENLRQNSKNSEMFLDDKINVSKDGITSIDTASEIAPEQLPSYSQEVLTNYSIQSLEDDSSDHRRDAEFEIIPALQNLHSIRKTRNEQDEQDVSLATATTASTIITPVIAPDLEESSVNMSSFVSKESTKKASPLYSGRKHETITAELHIRNPKNLKPTMINISASDNKMRKPCWMIVKSYQSPSDIFDENIPNENFIKEGIVRIRSDTNLNKKIEKSQITNFLETTKKQPSTIITIPVVKQEESEGTQAKKKLISSDSKLQSKMNYNLTVETQIDTSIRSKIITRKLANYETKISTIDYISSTEISKIDDETYYSNEIELDEYILNELAMIRKWRQMDAWLLEQFSGICINTVLHLLLELSLKKRFT